RRSFLKTGAGAVVGGSVLAGNLGLVSGAFAGGSDVLKIGLIGCGGRGSGAAANALEADPNVKLVAMGDLFPDRLADSLRNLQGSQFKDRVDVPQDRQFSGWDAYKKVLETDIDVVLLTTPPHFRPEHIKAAVAAGKHIFAEKPVAVDAPGVHSVMATCVEAAKKNLAVVSGLCWRYDHGMRATFQQVLGGAVGDIVAIQATYNTNTLKQFPRKEGWSDMEWQLRNWQHFTWASGDFNVEQHIHSLDKVAWAMKDETPIKATGTGGRQARQGAESGHVFDHFSVVYEYANGVKAFCNCRQMDGCSNDVSDFVFGTKGTCDVFKHRVKGEKDWKFSGSKGNMYVTEHAEMLASIRAGKPINNGEYMCKSTMMAIMGRMSAYTGQTLTWEQAFNSKENLTPHAYEFGPLAMPSVAVPGLTPFA
ncbi:MAG: oxidoreductase domain protein, partial [Planctomycetaceae bacterium]|nr:oxidoreductase domain protein [Planctomycetaceae bacterium]